MNTAFALRPPALVAGGRSLLAVVPPGVYHPMGMALIGDRERERAAGLLRSHYVRGCLTLEELGERLEVAIRARRDSEVRIALAGLPARWREQDARAGLDAVWQATQRAVFVVAVWALWWAASLVLLIGFVTSVVLQGLSLTSLVGFP